MRSAASCDVLVIGGGPAGSTAAQLLSTWGRSVVLVHRAGPAAHALAESLPPSTRKLLRFLGQIERVDAASPYPNTGNLVHWAGAERTIGGADTGFHVSRGAFDDVLRDGARGAGARVIDGVVRRIDDADPVRVTVATPDARPITCDAHVVLDCSGRAGIVARRGLRRPVPAMRTLAIVAEWECGQWPADERTLTTVESYADGWAWSVPLSATRRQCTVMVERSAVGRSAEAVALRGLESRSTKAIAVQQTYERELAKTTALAARLTGARKASEPWCCDSSLYDSIRAAEGRMLLVGDAASFIEPLSSAGVKKALVSAWRAAVVANTSLVDRSMASAAMDLHSRREKEVFVECQRRSATFFADAAAAYATPFWTTRAAACGSLTPASEPASEEFSDDRFSSEPGIQQAFERLRRDAPVRLRPSQRVRFAPVPVIAGRQVVMRDALVVPGGQRPLQFAAGVDLTRLVRIAASCNEVPSIIDAYHRQVGPAPVQGVLAGLSLLIAREALVAEAASV